MDAVTQALRISWKPRWFIDETVLEQEGNPDQGRSLTYRALELGSNNFSVTLVASLGFLTGSYVLFFSNHVLPMLGFVYWHDATKSTHETAFNNLTTSGCIVGMLVFGIGADLFGRRKMYGFELVVLMTGVLGMAMTSTGYLPFDQLNGRDPTTVDFGSFGSMNFQSWLLFWRFVSGIGVGGEYPLSAVIASEFAPCATRPRILAIVFLMQAFGIASGSVVSLITTKIVRSRHPYDPAHPFASARAVDQIWRWVVGLALIPAFITAIMRFTIPESPRYTLDVQKNPRKAFEETEKLRGLSDILEIPRQLNTASILSGPVIDATEGNGSSLFSDNDGERRGELDGDRITIKQYFWVEGNWRYLAATSSSWFLSNFALNALGLSNAQTLSKFWNGSAVVVTNPKVWNSNTIDPNASIFSILIENSVHLLVVVSVPAITGGILLVLFITRLNRRMLAWVMFLVTGSLLVIIGATLLKTVGTQNWGISVTLYALCNLTQEFGMGPLTFLLPAELFPTKYRASCHGISAASGKLGSVLSSIFLRYVMFGTGAHRITSSSMPSVWLSYVLLVFSAPLFLAAALLYLWLPELQDSAGKSKTLEQLAEGRRSTTREAVAPTNVDEVSRV